MCLSLESESMVPSETAACCHFMKKPKTQSSKRATPRFLTLRNAWDNQHLLFHAAKFQGNFFFLVFLGLYPQHMEVPRPGVELELQLLSYKPQAQQHGI